VLIAQITDTHIRPKGKLLHHMVPTARYLRRCIVQLETMSPRPDVVIATGDLVDRGKPKEYRRLRKILGRLQIPLFVLPGNHDDRAAFRDAFADHRYLPARGPLHYAIEAFPLRLIGLDTTRKKHAAAELDDVRLDWFEACLREGRDRPTLVFMHHAPFAIGIAPVDAHGFRGLDRFAQIVARNPQIVRVVCGHIHRSLTVPFARTVAYAAPSTAPQLVLDRSPAGFMGIRLEAAGFALHRWTGQTLETTLQLVEAYRAPAQPRLSVAS
jgi:Icc protein